MASRPNQDYQSLLVNVAKAPRQSSSLYEEMEFPPHIVKWLNKRHHEGYSNHLKENRTSIEEILREVGLSRDEEITHFYLNFGPASFGGWYELTEANEIKELIEYARDELELDEDYLPLTSIEGEGITLYKKSTGQVFDVEFGQFELLEENKLAPIAESFAGFLEWAKQKDEKNLGRVKHLI